MTLPRHREGCMTVSFYTLGCKVNQYESQAMAELFAAAGYELAGADGEADVYVINSCTVTAESDRKTRQAVRRFKRLHPRSVVVLAGCMTQAYSETAGDLPEADIVTGNKDHAGILKLLEEYFAGGERTVRVEPHQSGEPFETAGITGFSERTRAVVKIEDGCDRFCSYCIIPYARGRVRSKPLEELKTELTRLEAAGFAEIVLVGINLSAYGSDSGSSLVDAAALACSFEGIQRVRLGSLEPDLMTGETVTSLRSLTKLCPHFHLSLQSGCDKTLRDMNRHYTTAQYKELCDTLRGAFQDCSITTDIMVGFPGETKEDFSESLGFVRQIGFEKVHVFPYSPRPGTKAAGMKPQIPKAVKEERARRMTAAAQEIRNQFLENQIGKVVEVLVEEHSPGGSARGYTPNYTPVQITGDAPVGTICRIKITGAGEDWCVGERV